MRRTSLCGKAVFLLACFCLAGATTLSRAQQGPDGKPRGPNYAGLENSGFALNTWDTLEATRQVGFRNPDRLDDPARFMLDYRSRNWAAVGQRLHEMTSNQADRVYSKILSDLDGGEKPPLSLDDILAILDLCPSDLVKNEEWIGQIGSLIKGVTRPWEAPLLGARLEQGTRLAGGRNPEQRLLAGRILMHTDFVDLAKTFLPAPAEAAALPAGTVRDGILKFLGVMKARDQALETQAKLGSGESFQALVDASQDRGRWENALNELRERLKTIPPPVLMSLVRQMMAKDRVAGQNLVQAILQRMAWEGRVRSADEQQAGYMQMQLDLADLLASLPDVPEDRRKLLLTSMVENWIQQAEITLREKPEYDKRRSDPNVKPRFVSPDLLVATAPRGAVWSPTVPPMRQERVNLLVPKLQMCSDDPDPALGMIMELAKRDSQSAGLLAQDFVQRWAELRDPRISEPIRQRYNLAPGSAIVVTPIRVRKNVEGLANMMDLLRRNKIVPGNYARIFEAFDFCYGNADVYQVADIEKVFGPIGDMPEALFNDLIGKMQENLGTRWRSMATQQAALYNRGQDQLLEMLRKGYADAVKMLDARAAKRPGEWRAPAIAGILLSDWGDLEYFQELTKNPPKERGRLYREKNMIAQDYFLKACQSYARGVPGLDAKQYSVESFTAWFNSLLGLNSNGEINLSKALNREALTRLHDVLRGIPGPAAESHMALFAKIIAARAADLAKPLPPELKFKYLASGLLVTADSASGAAAQKKLDYYNELLSGVRVETRVDGSNTVWRKADFGIIVSLAHSEFMGRIMKFDKYITTQPAPNNKGPVKRMNLETVARNDFERSLLEALTPFFDVRSVTFSPKDVQPRPTGQPGWQETVLAYVQVRAKDVSVDRIPPIEMKLDYVDLDGPVQIPATSAETLIRMVEEKTPPRPCGDFQITQTLDLRPANGGGMAKLIVAVSGSGLVPELDEVVNMAPLQACLPVKKIESKEGLLVKSLQSWADQVQATSECQWVLTLDSTPLREAQTAFDINFPAPRDTNSVVKNEMFKEEDLMSVAGSQVTIPKAAAEAAGAAQNATTGLPDTRRLALWGGLAVSLLAVVLAAGALIGRAGKRKARPPRIGEVFHVPERIDAFVAVKFLRNLATSELAHFRPAQKAEIAAVISRIERAGFDQTQMPLPEAELRETARHWLREAR